MDFPRLMFRSPGPEQCQGGNYAHKLVHSAEEFEGHLDEGWHGTLPDALEPPMPQWMRDEQEQDRREAARLADEEANKANAERLAREQAEQAEAERMAAEKAQRVEAERKAKEDAANAEAARIETERLAAEKKADERPPTGEELRAKAKELGLVFKRNATDAEIGKLIAAKLAGA